MSPPFQICRGAKRQGNFFGKSETVEQLKKALLEAGLDQADVAKLLGKTQPHISKIEAGQRRLDITQLKEFAKIYKKDINYFIK